MFKKIFLINFLFLMSWSLWAKDKCGYKFAFDLKYDQGKISYDGGFFNNKKSYCDTSRFESNANLVVKLIDGKRVFTKKVFISEVVFNDVVEGMKIKGGGTAQSPIFRQLQFELPAKYNEKEVTLQVNNLKNKTLLERKIKISNK